MQYRPARSTLLLLILSSIQYAKAYIQNAVCPQCSTLGSQYGAGSYNGYTAADSNPLSYFNGPTDFGNHLGKAIATKINEVYTPDTTKSTFGSYPTSSTYGAQSYGTQGFGGQNYVIQPDMYQQALTGYGGQALGGAGVGSGYPTTFSSFPGFSGYTGQQTLLPSSGGYTFGNLNNLGLTSYGNYGGGYGGYGSYGIPDPITTGVAGTGGSCPYCFGNKGGFARKSKRGAKDTEIKK